MDSEKVITAEKVEESENLVQDTQPQENDQPIETQQTSESNPTTEVPATPENQQNPETDVAPETNQAEQEKAPEDDQKTVEDKKPEETQQVVEATETEKVEEATQTIGNENVKEENVDEATQTNGEDKVGEEEKVEEGTQTNKEEGTETKKVEEGNQTEEPEKATEDQKPEEEGLEAKYKRIIDEAKKLYDDVLPLDQWEFYGEKNGIKSYTRTDPVTGIKMVRGEGTINRPASKFYEVVLDPARIRNWETNLCSHQKIDTIGDVEVYRSLDQKRMFVTQRETLIASRVFKQEDGTILTIQKSCDHPDVPEVNNLVRASVGLFAWQFVPGKEDENITQTTCMLYIDIKGSVPTMLFNMFVSDMAQNVLKLKNYVEKAF